MNKEKTTYGITGIYKPSSIPATHKPIGFTPIHENKLADVNYLLHGKLGQGVYRHFEQTINKHLSEGKTSLIISDGPIRIDIEVVTEDQFNKNEEKREEVLSDTKQLNALKLRRAEKEPGSQEHKALQQLIDIAEEDLAAKRKKHGI